MCGLWEEQLFPFLPSATEQPCCYGDSSLAGESTELHRTECLFPQQMHIHYAWCSEKPANAEVSIIKLFPLTWLLGTLVCL